MNPTQNQGSGWLLILLGLGLGYLALRDDEGDRGRDGGRDGDEDDGPRVNPFFGLFGGDDDGPKKGQRAYTATALNKRDPDDDVHPAETFYARTKPAARKKVVKWLKGSGRDPRAFKIELEAE